MSQYDTLLISATIPHDFVSHVKVKEWLQHLGLGDHSGGSASFHGHEDEEYFEDTHPSSSSRRYLFFILINTILPLIIQVYRNFFPFNLNRDVPSSAAFPVIRPALGRLSSISMKAVSAMQDYLNHFLGSLDIVNTREVIYMLCLFMNGDVFFQELSKKSHS